MHFFSRPASGAMICFAIEILVSSNMFLFLMLRFADPLDIATGEGWTAPWDNSLAAKAFTNENKMYMAATTLANYVMTQRGGRDGGMFRCAALLSESLFPTDRAPKPLIHPVRCQGARTDMEEFVKLRADAHHSGLPPASLHIIKGCSPVLIWATVLGGFRSYKCNGAKFAEEWTRLGRSIVSCCHVGLDDNECIITSLNHSRQLRSLGKSAELTCVQIAQLVVEMKDLMTADMLAEQSRAPPPGKKRKLKEVTQEMLAKGFADQNAGDTGGTYRLSSTRVIRAYLKVADGFLTSQGNYDTYYAMLEKWGPECVFHCSYAVEAILIGLGKEHKAQVPDFFRFLGLDAFPRVFPGIKNCCRARPGRCERQNS